MAFVDVLLGGALAIAGGVIATTLQSRAQRQARLEEREERRREIRRRQAERVLEELHGLLSAYHEQQMVLFRQMTGGADSKVELRPATSSSLLGVVSIYFPECVVLVEKFDEDVLAIMKESVALISESFKSRPNDDKAIKQAHLAMTKVIIERASKFSEQLRSAMKGQIEKLW